jgi:hypothetical protein
VAAPKRTTFERELDLARIASMYLGQKTQREIAAELGLSQGAIHRDISEVRRRWRESSIVDMNEAKQRELDRIDQLERMYRDAYTRSMGEKVTTRTEQEGRGAAATTKAIVQREQLIGNPAFLNGIQSCIEQRCKILGIYEATKISLDWRRAVEERGLDAGEVFEQMVAAAKRAIGGIQ